MKTKLEQFKQNLLCSTYDIAMITETWLNDSICDAELGLTGFTTYRMDRDFNQTVKKDGGGVAIFVRNSIFSKQIHPPVNIVNSEQLFVIVKSQMSKFIFGCTYLPNYSSKDVYEAHCQSVQALADSYPIN